MPRTVQRFGSWRDQPSTIVTQRSASTFLAHTPRARWIGGERLLKNLFAAELPEELFRKVLTFWAPVWK